MCGGGGDPFQAIGDTLASIDPGPAIGSGLAELDKGVNSAIPGGWITVGALAGGGLALAYAPEVMAFAESMGVSPEVASASLNIPPVDAATGEVVALSPDVFGGLSASAPVDTTLSQAAADSLANFVGPTGVADIPAADAAAEAYANAQSGGLNFADLVKDTPGFSSDSTGNIVQTFDDGSTITLDQSGNVISSTEAVNPIQIPSGATDVAKSLAKQAASKLLSSATSNLATGKGVLGLPSTSLGLGSYGANLTGDTTGGATAPNLTPDLTKGNIDFTLMGAPTTATTPQIFNVGTNPAAYAPIASTPQQTPGFAQGGDFEEEPQFYSVGGLESMNNHYVQGDGDGTSDSVNAKLADGEFVIPADVVAKLGNGSNNAGASVLDQFLTTIREHKQENGTKLEPDSKGPLAYLLDAKKKARA